jgi:F0F1-type ATP synthase epsilon subunit
MKLVIISPESTVEHTIAWIELPTHDGSIVVQRGHEPLLVILKSNQPIVFKLKTGKQAEIIIQDGLARIEREEVLLIVQLAHSI